MTRKQILALALSEIRNEFADALDGLDAAQLAATPVAGRNPISWIVCHCLRTMDRVLHEGILGSRCLAEDLDRHVTQRDDAPLSAQRLADLAGEADRTIAACIDAVEQVDEGAFAEPLPRRDAANALSVAGGCVLMMNHCNAHLRQIWLLREALGDRSRWPVQTMYRGKADGEGEFYLPSREQILEDRAARRKTR